MEGPVRLAQQEGRATADRRGGSRGRQREEAAAPGADTDPLPDAPRVADDEPCVVARASEGRHAGAGPAQDFEDQAQGRPDTHPIGCYVVFFFHSDGGL